MSDEEIIQNVKLIINKVRPYIQQDGGDCIFLEYKNHIVYIRMIGACEHCVSQEFTVKNVIEDSILESVPEVVAVVNLV